MTTVLIVDDNELNRYQLEVLLGASGYRVVSCTNGAEALAAARQQPPDLIVSDILMPVMDGFTLCREWRQDERLRHIPFMFYTATYTDERDREFALGLGAQDFLIKPEEPEVFVAKVREAIHSLADTAVSGVVPPTATELVADTGYLRQYNETLIRKLEQKMAQLEVANRQLERDIAERQAALAALAEAERFARAIIEALPVHLCVLDQAGRILAVNQAWREFVALGPPAVATGTEGEDYLAACLADGDAASAALAEGVRAVLDGHQADYADEWACPLAGGTEWFVRRAARFAGGPPVRVAITFQNITKRARAEAERARLEAQVRQQQRLEAIGTLAAGVAHEINNPIQGVVGYAELIRAVAPPTSELAENAALILHEADRVTGIVRNLLQFARQDRPDPQHRSPTRPADVVADALSLIRAVLRHDHVDLQVEVPADLPVLPCHSRQVQQVLVNLLTNARDALNDKYAGRHPDKCIRLSGRTFEDNGTTWVRLTVEDHGPGITEAVGERLMDPFYTTKPGDRGTGLGLSISHGIARDHRGRLWYETEVGHWTRFHIDLPTDDPEPSPPSPVQHQRPGVAQSAG